MIFLRDSFVLFTLVHVEFVYRNYCIVPGGKTDWTILVVK